MLVVQFARADSAQVGRGWSHSDSCRDRRDTAPPVFANGAGNPARTGSIHCCHRTGSWTRPY